MIFENVQNEVHKNFVFQPITALAPSLGAFFPTPVLGWTHYAPTALLLRTCLLISLGIAARRLIGDVAGGELALGVASTGRPKRKLSRSKLDTTADLEII